MVLWPESWAFFIPLCDVISVTAPASEAKWWEDKAIGVCPYFSIPHVQSERKVQLHQHFKLPRAYFSAAVAVTTVPGMLEEWGIRGVLGDPFPTS